MQGPGGHQSARLHSGPLGTYLLYFRYYVLEVLSTGLAIQYNTSLR